MRLSDFVCFEAIVPELEATDRDGIISELVGALEIAGKISKAEIISKAIIKRENEASTGVGKGVAVPHVKHKGISEVVATVGGKSEGVDFSSLDKQPVYSVILLLSPVNDSEKHLQAMESIFKNLQNDDFRRFLRQARTAEQFKEVITETHENS